MKKGEKEERSSNPTAKQRSCNTTVLITHKYKHTHTHTRGRINVLLAERLVSKGSSLSLLSSICGQITDIIGCKRDSLSTTVFFSFRLSWGLGMSLCTPAAAKEMKAKNVADVSPC